MGLDDALEYITDDEQVEVTPLSIRIRKVRDRDSCRHLRLADRDC